MKYPWLQEPMTLEYMVLHCVEDAGGCVHHFTMQLFKQKGVPFTTRQVAGALQRAKKRGLVENVGSYWRIKPC